MKSEKRGKNCFDTEQLTGTTMDYFVEINQMVSQLQKAFDEGYSSGAQSMRDRAAKSVEQMYDDGREGAHSGEFCIRASASIRALPMSPEEKP